MYQETDLQRDVAVSGLLSAVLYISRLAGVAPLKFEREYGGWRVSISRPLIVLDCILSVLIPICSLLFIISRPDDVKDRFDSSTNNEFMFIAASIILFAEIIVVIPTSFSNQHRFSHTIDCLAQLQKLNNKMERRFGFIPASEVKTKILVIFGLISAVLSSILEYTLYLVDVLMENGRVSISCYLYIAVFIIEIQAELIAAQYSLAVAQLVSTQKKVNFVLRKVLLEIRNKGLSNGDKMVNHLADIYCSLCSVLKQLNNCNGIALMSLLVFIVIHVVMLPYFIVAVLFRNKTHMATIKALGEFTCWSYCMFMLVVISEPSHQSHKELKLTRILLNQMLRFVPHGSAIKYELKMFKRHIFLNPVKFQPMHMVVLERNIVPSVLSIVLGYLSVVMNL